MHVDVDVMVCSLQIENLHVPQRCIVKRFILMGQYLHCILSCSFCGAEAIMFVFIPVTADIFALSLRDKVGIDARSVKWGRVSCFERSIINFLLDIVMFVLAL